MLITHKSALPHLKEYMEAMGVGKMKLVTVKDQLVKELEREIRITHAYENLTDAQIHARAVARAIHQTHSYENEANEAQQERHGYPSPKPRRKIYDYLEVAFKIAVLGLLLLQFIHHPIIIIK